MMKKILLILCLLYAVASNATTIYFPAYWVNQTQQITVAVNTSRTSGAGPLSVFFDAKATTSTTCSTDIDCNFTKLQYVWDFGDSVNNGAWGYGTHTGATCNSTTNGIGCTNWATSPEASHLYVCNSGSTCSFTPSVTVFDGTNSVTHNLPSITVTDPNVTFSGTKTICVAATILPVAGSGGFPTGAAVALQPDFYQAISIYQTQFVASGLVPTSGGSNAFSLSGNYASSLYAGMIVKITGTSGTEYGRITSENWDGVNTNYIVVNISGNTSGTLSTLAWGIGGSRVLFNGGDTFAVATTPILTTNGPGFIGSYGTGNAIIQASTGLDELDIGNPQVPSYDHCTNIYNCAGGATGAYSQIGDWRIVNLNFVGFATAQGSAVGINMMGSFNQLTLSGVNFTQQYISFGNNDQALDGVNAGVYCCHNAYQQLTIQNSTALSPIAGTVGNAATLAYGMYFSGDEVAFQGNHIDLGGTASAVVSHVARLTYIGAGVVTNNTLSHPGPTEQNIKLMAPSFPGGIGDSDPSTGGVCPATYNGTKGAFTSTSALQTAFPAASFSGWGAAIGTAVPYTQYYSNGTSWNQVLVDYPTCLCPNGQGCPIVSTTGWADGNYTPIGGGYTRYVEIADNEFDGSYNSYMVTAAPQNQNSDERERDIIFERNFFNAGGKGTVSVAAYGTGFNYTIRNNLFSMIGVSATYTITFEAENGGSIFVPPDHLEMYNNSLYSDYTSSSNDIHFLVTGTTTTNVMALNNLAYTPNSTNGSTSMFCVYNPSTFNCASIADITGNSTTAQMKGVSPLFSVIPPTTPSAFKPTTGSYAIGSGTTVPLWNDFFNLPRTIPYDMGAVNH